MPTQQIQVNNNNAHTLARSGTRTRQNQNLIVRIIKSYSKINQMCARTVGKALNLIVTEKCVWLQTADTHTHNAMCCFVTLRRFYVLCVCASVLFRSNLSSDHRYSKWVRCFTCVFHSSSSISCVHTSLSISCFLFIFGFSLVWLEGSVNAIPLFLLFSSHACVGFWAINWAHDLEYELFHLNQQMNQYRSIVSLHH